MISECRSPEATIHWARPESIDLKKIWLLSVAEQNRADNFLFDEDRQLFLASHIFLRLILSSYSGVMPEKIQFSFNAYGKPFLVGKNDLHFNLSHTQGMIVCAMSFDGEIGVDVENMNRPLGIESILKVSFSTAEAEHVLKQKCPTERHQLFFTYWTLKEAYVKGLGQGLSVPLRDCQFSFDATQGWQLSVANKVNIPEWKFYSSTLDDEYILSVGLGLSLFTANQDFIVRMTDSNSRETLR